MTRREFVGGALAAAGAGALGMSAAGAAKPGDIRAVYLSIGTGMWWSEYCEYKGRMIVHEPTWRRLTASIESSSTSFAPLVAIITGSTTFAISGRDESLSATAAIDSAPAIMPVLSAAIE